MQKYGEIKDLVNAVLESYDKYPVIQNIDCRSRINSESVNDLLEAGHDGTAAQQQVP